MKTRTVICNTCDAPWHNSATCPLKNNPPCKECVSCYKSLPFKSFNRRQGQKNKTGFCDRCKICGQARKSKKWRRKNPELSAPFQKTVCERGEYQREYARKYRKFMMAQFREMYGQKCACCGDPRIQFLVVDHVVPIRRAGKRGQSALRDALKEYRPDLFQTLCHNCNSLKGASDSCPCGTQIVEIMEK